jgi:hypothetical protein
MATSSPNPNNVTVKFRGKGEREMPKPPQMDVSTGKPMKGSSGKPKMSRRMRKQVKKAQNRGAISDKAMKRMTGEE